MGSGWAYVDCADSGGGQAAGPTGSVQFLTGANATSGSAKLLFHTSAGGHTNTLILTGTLIVSGNISASSYTIKNIHEIDGTGSTYFGDTYDDLHVRTGSLEMWNGTIADPPYFVAAVSVRGRDRGIVVQSGSISGHYSASTATTLKLGGDEYIVGIRGLGNVSVELKNAAWWNGEGGYLLVIKDEVQYRTGSITITSKGSKTIDGESSYELSGTMPAVNLYSDGANWFVY
jgi:hypothetical protein